MANPTTGIRFNSVTPAAPSGDQNISFQSDGGTPQQQITGYPRTATTSLRGVVKPDGTTITVASDGTISAVGGGGGGSFAVTDGPNTFEGGLQTIVTESPSSVGLVVEGSAGSTPGSFVQTANGTGNGGVSATFPSDVTVGNTIIVVSQDDRAAGSFTDNLGNTYTQVGNSTAYAYNQYVYVAYVATGGSCTVSLSGSFFGSIVILEYNGVLETSPLDGSPLYVGGGSLANPQSVGSLTTSQFDLILTLLSFADSNTQSATAAGFTVRADLTLLALDAPIVVADMFAPAGTYDTSWVPSATGGSWSAMMIAFKVAIPQQTADLAQFKSSSGTTLSTVNAEGQFVLPSTSGVPTNTPNVGAMAFDPATKKLWIYDGTSWVSTTLA